MFYVICIKRFKRFRKDGTPNFHSVQTYYIVQQQLIIQSMQIGENEAGAGFERIERGTRGPSRDNVILFHLLFLDLVYLAVLAGIWLINRWPNHSFTGWVTNLFILDVREQPFRLVTFQTVTIKKMTGDKQTDKKQANDKYKHKDNDKDHLEHPQWSIPHNCDLYYICRCQLSYRRKQCQIQRQWQWQRQRLWRLWKGHPNRAIPKFNTSTIFLWKHLIGRLYLCQNPV